jgi:hypothetical protein
LHWASAARTPRFVDMLTGTPAPLETTAAILWDEKALYVAFWAAEPNVAGTMTKRDDLLFFESELEMFIDGGDCHCELEFNALGRIHEVFPFGVMPIRAAAVGIRPTLMCIRRGTTRLVAIMTEAQRHSGL